MTKITAPIREACKRLLGEEPLDIDRPGGARRRSVRVQLKDRTVVLTRRKHKTRAKLEASILNALSNRGAPVPRLLGFDGVWLAQEDVGSQRLSEKLAGATVAEGRDLMTRALDGLVAAQRAAAAAGLSRHMVVLGHSPEWLRRFATGHLQVGRVLDVPPPQLDLQQLCEILAVTRPGFVKWDARPGNAAVQDDGRVVWFDWEHAGLRQPTDDLAWFLCDEYTPFDPDRDPEVVARYLSAFDPKASGQDYLRTYGVFHSLVRLSLILHYKGDKAWWSEKRCLERDNVGVTHAMATRLCARAACWADASSAIRPLADWFRQVQRRFD